ncbi:hypothetical protein JOB18_026518 [Solea senegalensis]|uniref:Uncharacterized protein n=1 Tax=Solea senegalensis TaxID=28829 RepID=A0AAV6SJ04_SOLSE|nr:hypothetical protein JOB18_026518 [Solea senegalensis]
MLTCVVTCRFLSGVKCESLFKKFVNKETILFSAVLKTLRKLTEPPTPTAPTILLGMLAEELRLSLHIKEMEVRNQELEVQAMLSHCNVNAGTPAQCCHI